MESVGFTVCDDGQYIGPRAMVFRILKCGGEISLRMAFCSALLSRPRRRRFGGAQFHAKHRDNPHGWSIHPAAFESDHQSSKADGLHGKRHLEPNPDLIKTLVIIPTYNERDNIAELIRAIRTHTPEADVLVVDDGSPDGTGQLVRTIGETDSRVGILQRGGKLGLGTAYIEGFRHALREGYNCVVGMDADFSHDPACLPQFIAAAAQCDLVIGSRYVPGGSTPDWKIHRRLISRFGNWIARTVLEIPVRDCTTAYRCYRREALAALDLDAIDVVGYSFLIETTRQCFAAGLRFREIPITFIDRREGKSKMSGTIIFEALRYIVFRCWQRNRRT